MSTMNSTSSPTPLTRSTTDRKIGGVAGGLARHLGVDPVLVRVGFAVSILFSGAGLIAYLVMLALVPSDDAAPAGAHPRHRLSQPPCAPARLRRRASFTADESRGPDRSDLHDRHPAHPDDQPRPVRVRGAALEPAPRHPRAPARSGTSSAASSAPSVPTGAPTPRASAPPGSTATSSSSARRRPASRATSPRTRPARSSLRARRHRPRLRGRGDLASPTRATPSRWPLVYNEGGWPAKVEGDAFTAPYSAPSAGPPPWYVYRFVYDTVFGVATAEPFRREAAGASSADAYAGGDDGRRPGPRRDPP